MLRVFCAKAIQCISPTISTGPVGPWSSSGPRAIAYPLAPALSKTASIGLNPSRFMLTKVQYRVLSQLWRNANWIQKTQTCSQEKYFSKKKRKNPQWKQKNPQSAWAAQRHVTFRCTVLMQTDLLLPSPALPGLVDSTNAQHVKLSDHCSQSGTTRESLDWHSRLQSDTPACIK